MRCQSVALALTLRADHSQHAERRAELANRMRALLVPEDETVYDVAGERDVDLQALGITPQLLAFASDLSFPHGVCRPCSARCQLGADDSRLRRAAHWPATAAAAHALAGGARAGDARQSAQGARRGGVCKALPPADDCAPRRNT